MNYTECVQGDRVPGLRKVVEAVGKGFVHLRCCAVGRRRRRQRFSRTRATFVRERSSPETEVDKAA